MIIKIKLFLIIFFIIFLKNLFSYEIIRDAIFEDYFADLSEELKLKKVNVYLVNDKSANAFVIYDNIYFTVGLIKEIYNEDTLRAIYLHEYGHIKKNHFQIKKIELTESKYKNNYFNLFSIGIAVFTSNPNIGIGTSISLNNTIVNKISKHSINFEIEADNFMIDKIKENKINTSELINFLSLYKLNDTNNTYFRTHPRSSDRINNLKGLNYNLNKNSEIFEWIKAKYSNNSNNNSFNNFFRNLQKGVYYQGDKIDKINEQLIKYEVFKKGLYLHDWHNIFSNLLTINNSSFLKIEYINYLLDNNLENKYYLIEDLKFNNKVMNEYFYYYIYGKYYNKINNKDLSNFYFCQFYKIVDNKNKADFFCKKYDIKNIPTLDKAYALFK